MPSVHGNKYAYLEDLFTFTKEILNRKLFCAAQILQIEGIYQIRVPKVPFRVFFDKLKYEIRNIVLSFVSILKLR